MASVTTYTATATREGRYWVVEVVGVGVTQGRSLSEARDMAADLVVAVHDVPAKNVDIELVIDLPGGLTGRVREARQQSADAERAQRQAADQLRNAVVELRKTGLTGRDLADVLGVSPQRISQLAPVREKRTATPAPAGSRAKKANVKVKGIKTPTSGAWTGRTSRSKTSGMTAANDNRPTTT